MKSYFVLVVALVIAAPSSADEEIDALIRAEIESAEIPGLAIAVLEEGASLFVKAYGTANLESGDPVTEASVFELASLTKQFTAATVLLLAADGKLSLDDTVTDYVAGSPAAWQGIRLRHLLSHTGGLADRFEETVNGRSIMDHSAEEMIQSAIATPMIGDAGEQWSYSDQGYVLLGHVIEQASAGSYEEIVREELLTPAGMTDSHFHDPSVVIPGRVAGYELHKGELRNVRRDWQFGIVSHYGLMASITDMVAWEKSLVERSVLSDDLLETLWTPHWQISESDVFTMSYGFGWFVAELGDYTVVEHTGITGTSYLRVLDSGLTVILLTNLAYYDISRLGRRIARLLDPAIPFPEASLQ